ncbi:hypothetical protein K402DRAFT_342719 [Aulographum hederae CBS 113979]|uniref:Uncharacterized protein n=1 Tax=Aulographum hederae CBS 113979 TaxID=1176131 RepID=A0A6G1GK34_9PEZI|nr:hypothetical protein K402DRAFT_342719 [Aulographum hederae CBS 113979]
MIKGVKINCLGDEKVFGKPHFEAVEVPLSDSIFFTHRTSPIAERIGIPIFTRRCPQDPKWKNLKDAKLFGHESPANNQDATFLHTCCHPETASDPCVGSMGWNFAPWEWMNAAGTILVVRQDKKPLLPLQMEALAKYCRYEARPLMTHCTGVYAPEKPMEKTVALSMISRTTFVVFWYKLLDRKREEGVKIPDEPLPYDEYEEK